MFPEKQAAFRLCLIHFLLGLVMIGPGNGGAVLRAEAESNKAEPMAELSKVGAGILFDGQGNLYAGTEDQLVRVTPNGKVTTVCTLSQLPPGRDYFFLSPLIWQMVWDRQRNIIAAAQDRILRITADGRIQTLIQKNSFGGFLGASGVEIDRDGYIYVTDGGKIIRYSPEMKAAIYIDCTKNARSYTSFLFLNFDPAYKNLYISDFSTRSLLRFPIAADGTPGEPEVLIEGLQEGAPLNVIFGKRGEAYVSVDISSKLIKINPAGQIEWINLGAGANHIIAFGGKGFDEESIYFTTYNGKIYRFNIGENGLK